MTISERKLWCDHVLDYLELDDLWADFQAQERCMYPKREYLPIEIAREMVQNGFFACYYSQVDDALKKIYYGHYDRNKYYTKHGYGDLRWRKGEAVIWATYKDKVSQAICYLLKGKLEERGTWR